jgi:hypothetical protein
MNTTQTIPNAWAWNLVFGAAETVDTVGNDIYCQKMGPAEYLRARVNAAAEGKPWNRREVWVCVCYAMGLVPS